MCDDKYPLFIALKKPYGAISARTVSRILDKSIALVGLNGFNAKCLDQQVRRMRYKQE